MEDKKVAIYIRVSTDFQAEEGYSIDAQKEQLSAYCVAKGWKNYIYYIDGGWSGSNIERPEIKKLIRDIEDDKVSTVLVYKLDRLSRSQKDTLYLIEDVFNANQVDFISLTESLDTSTPMGKLMIGILAAFAQLERENIKMRTRMGMKERVKDGFWMGGGRVPFGYDYDRNQGILVPNKDADTVRDIYELYIQGESPQAIANLLGLQYDRLVTQILTRKTNYGIIEYNGEEYQGRHQPLISKETYDEAMNQMKIRSKSYITKSNYMLTGLLVCGHCGAKMRYQRWGKDGRAKIVCYSQQRSKKYLIKDPNCPQPRIWASEIDEAVIQRLFSFELTFMKNEYVDDSEVKTRKSILLKQQKDLERKIRRLYNLYAEDDSDILKDEIEKAKQSLGMIEKEIEEDSDIMTKKSSAAKIQEQLSGLESRWSYMDDEEKQHYCETIIDKVIVTDNKVEVILND